MREIKFRAWDKITKKYFYSGTLDNGDILVIHLDGEIEISSDDTYKPDDFIIEQFTGLRDKNGREIYEGDKVFVDCSIEHSLNIHGMVKYSFGSFNIVDGEEIHYSFSEIPDRIYINGNIHENQELLP